MKEKIDTNPNQINSKPIIETLSFQCRKGCAACCIAISISSVLPGMPCGKPAGIRCVNLAPDNSCTIHDFPDYPAICKSFSADLELCGKTNEEAFWNIDKIEKITSPV